MIFCVKLLQHLKLHVESIMITYISFKGTFKGIRTSIQFMTSESGGFTDGRDFSTVFNSESPKLAYIQEK